jgi:hypothetical protein
VSADQSPPRRPRLLTAALLVAWFIGLRTVHEGFLALRVLRDPLVGDSLSLPSELKAAFVEGIAGTRAALPLASAQVLLGGFLLLISVGILFGIARSASFGLQAVFANAALSCVAYAVSAPVRRALVQALVNGSQVTPDVSSELSPHELGNVFYWGFRLALAMQLFALAAVAWVLSRPAVREFLAFSPSARSEN